MAILIIFTKKMYKKDALSLAKHMNCTYCHPWFLMYSMIVFSETSPIVEQKYP